MNIEGWCEQHVLSSQTGNEAMKTLLVVSLALLCIAPSVVEGARSREVPRQFMRLHPCPGGPHQGWTRGACPGYVRDHIVPLCRNGADTVANMQWQTVAAAKAKDRWECRR